MAQAEVTGSTVQELAELKHEYEQSPKFEREGTPFETSWCLTRIGKQPEEYQGPTRYCSNRVARLDDGGHAHSCRFHGANQNADGNNDNLELLAAIKHGMYATDEHLQEVFTEADQKLYDFVLSWAETYGWPSKEEDPVRYDLLEQAAVARVRVARSEKYILDEGEMKREEIYDEAGNLREVDNPHALSEDIRLKRKLLIDIMKELGLTPKEQAKMGAEEKSASSAELLAEVAAEAVLGGKDDESESFDPDDPVFDEE